MKGKSRQTLFSILELTRSVMLKQVGRHYPILRIFTLPACSTINLHHPVIYVGHKPKGLCWVHQPLWSVRISCCALTTNITIDRNSPRDKLQFFIIITFAVCAIIILWWDTKPPPSCPCFNIIYSWVPFHFKAHWFHRDEFLRTFFQEPMYLLYLWHKGVHQPLFSLLIQRKLRSANSGLGKEDQILRLSNIMWSDSRANNKSIFPECNFCCRARWAYKCRFQIGDAGGLCAITQIKLSMPVPPPNWRVMDPLEPPRSRAWWRNPSIQSADKISGWDWICYHIHTGWLQVK